MLHLQIKNHQKHPLKIHDFVFHASKFRFSKQNQVHLFGPDGKDDFLPYYCSNCFTNEEQPIQIDSEGKYVQHLPISSHLHLRQAGDYTFWVELMDNNGQFHRSNELKFTLLTEESTVPVEQIKLILRPVKPSFSLTDSWNVEATLKNNAENPLTFLKPKEHSFYGWVNPIYQFTVIDKANRGLTLPETDIVYPPVDEETTRFTLAAGESYKQTLTIPRFPDMKKPGSYQVRLTYIVRETHLSWGVVTDIPMNWAEDVFVGVIESNEMTVTIE